MDSLYPTIVKDTIASPPNQEVSWLPGETMGWSPSNTLHPLGLQSPGETTKSSFNLHLSPADSCFIRFSEPNRSVGGGGYCDLYKGIYTPTGQKLALKRPRFSAQEPKEAEDAKRRFYREGRTWSTMVHINILPFLGMIEIANETYLISPWLDHGDLSKFLSARLRFLEMSEDERSAHVTQNVFERFNEYNIVFGIASGLAYLHQSNIVHGDMKAANVLLDVDVRPVLCDFGMTKILDSEFNCTSTAMKGAGSLRWMSPELMNNAPRTPGSDIYSFGMTIVITGKVPYPDLNNQFALAKALINGQRPPATPSTRNGRSFGNLWELASRCWEDDPAKRPSASDVAAVVSVALARSSGGDLDTVSDESTDDMSCVSDLSTDSPAIFSVGRPSPDSLGNRTKNNFLALTEASTSPSPARPPPPPPPLRIQRYQEPDDGNPFFFDRKLQLLQDQPSVDYSRPKTTADRNRGTFSRRRSSTL
ncbi:hypothetical protein FRB94_003080 [Tulasnella sp. JGI-2019a]|nr:hypothetical protein FRB94_003080 [Tulasnella sp. JGI-2019a]